MKDAPVALQNQNPPKRLTYKEKATFDLSKSEIRRDQTDVVSNRVCNLRSGPQLAQSC